MRKFLFLFWCLYTKGVIFNTKMLYVQAVDYGVHKLWESKNVGVCSVSFFNFILSPSCVLLWI